jgi:hypothetical protein
VEPPQGGSARPPQRGIGLDSPCAQDQHGGVTPTGDCIVKRFLLLALLLCPPPVLADEHLVPEDNQFTRAALPNGESSLAPYYEMVLKVLHDAYTPEVQARVIVMPSYGPEYAVGITETNGRYAVFQLSGDAQVWRYEMLRGAKGVDTSGFDESVQKDFRAAVAELEKSLPKKFDDIMVKRCEFAVPAQLGKNIVGVWKAALLQTRVTPERTVGRDGTDYHFSMPDETQQLSGKAWEPPTESDAGRLVRIVDTMTNLCKTEDKNLMAQLQPQVDALQARLRR